MPLDQLAEGGRVASAHLLDQLAVGHLRIVIWKWHTRYRRRHGRHCWVA
jgi:hypothetical protein